MQRPFRDQEPDLGADRRNHRTTKPTYQIDGQMIAWGDYLSQLQQAVDWCNEKLAGEAPFEVQSQGYT